MGIYIHVPFCRSKCYYCDFCSSTRCDGDVSDAYVNALCAEIEQISEKIRHNGQVPIADTVYFGGGTPTLLDCGRFERILRSVDGAFGIEKDAEITVETNPKTADAQKLAALRSLGVNRLSIGMQSVHDVELRALGRIHTFSDFKECLADAREAGIDNISADLMYGIPCQTRESFARSVLTLCELGVEHVSSYCLTVEPDTPFGRRKELILPDEDAVADMYDAMSELLEARGYFKYEISNFAHKGRESKHNNKYWTLEDYLGFGPAAHSFYDGVRYAHTRDIDAYCRGESIYCDVQRISGSEQMNEYVMLGMRLARGITIADFEARFNADFDSCFGQKLRKYAPEYVYIDGEVCRFTPRGMFVSNAILSDALDFGC